MTEDGRRKTGDGRRIAVNGKRKTSSAKQFAVDPIRDITEYLD
jgi:hypothetical protein